MLLSMMLMMLVSAAKEPESPEPPWPWPTQDELRPDTGSQDPSQLLEWLVSPDEAQRAEAQLRLLDSMGPLLPRLELLAARTPGEPARGWLREFLQVLTWGALSLEQLAPHPTLASLARQGVEQGHQLLSPWETGEPTEGIVEENRSGWCGTGPQPESKLHIEDPRLLETRGQLARWRGLARPAIERLLVSAFAPTRLRGMALANSMDMRPSPAFLTKLLKDGAQVSLQGKHDDAFGPGPRQWRRYPLSIPISRIAADLGWDRPPRPHPPHELFVVRLEERSHQWFAASRVLGDDPEGSPAWGVFNALLNGLRQVGGFTARNEQEYWNRVRPLWRAWWRSHAFGSDVPKDRQRWSNFVSRYQGMQYVASEQKPGQPTVFRLIGPVGTEVELHYRPNGRPSALPGTRRGVLPLTLRGGVPDCLLDLRVKIDGVWTDLALSFFPAPEVTRTLWLEPALRQAHLQRYPVKPRAP